MAIHLRDRVAQLLEERQLGPKEAAHVLGFSRSTLHRLLTGERPFQLPHVLALAQLFRLRPVQLLAGTREAKSLPLPTWALRASPFLALALAEARIAALEAQLDEVKATSRRSSPTAEVERLRRAVAEEGARADAADASAEQNAREANHWYARWHHLKKSDR